MAESRILVVDDSAFMRSRIKRLLTDGGMSVVGEARDGREAVEEYARLKPDLVTMDLTMRGADGLEGSREILRIDPEARIVLFSIIDDPDTATEALRCGVRAYVHKSRPQELLKRLEILASGEDSHGG